MQIWVLIPLFPPNYFWHTGDFSPALPLQEISEYGRIRGGQDGVIVAIGEGLSWIFLSAMLARIAALVRR